MNTGKRDGNEDKINEVLKACHIEYTDLKPGDGADKIIHVFPMEFWELKDPSQPPSKRRLTPAEKRKKEYCTRNRIPYVVIETVDDAVERLNLHFEKQADWM